MKSLEVYRRMGLHSKDHEMLSSGVDDTNHWEKIDEKVNPGRYYAGREYRVRLETLVEEELFFRPCLVVNFNYVFTAISTQPSE